MEIKLFDQSESHAAKEKIISFVRDNTRSDYNENKFQWQYGSEKSVFGFIQSEELILGTQGMIATELIHNDKILLTHKSETTFMSKDIRGSGLFEKTYSACVNKCKEKGSRIIWGFTALSNVWRNKLGFHVNENMIHEAVIIISAKRNNDPADNSIKGFRSLVQWGYYFLKGCIFKCKLALHNNKISKDIQIRPSDDLSRDISSLISKIEQFPKFYALNYSKEFINSRITKSLLNKYNSLAVYNNNVPAALAIYTSNMDTLRISECLFVDENSLKQLFSSIFMLAFSLKQIKISFWGNYSNPTYYKIFKLLKRYGSKTLPCKDMNFVILDCAETNDNTYNNLDKWLINGLWTEGYSY